MRAQGGGDKGMVGGLRGTWAQDVVMSHQSADSHGDKGIGSEKVHIKHASQPSVWPWEAGLARFSQDKMYIGEIVRHMGIREDVMHRMQSFHAGLRDFPFEKAAITPVLSEWTVMSALQKPLCISQYITNSSATDSTQPMSCPQDAQPSVRHQPAHLFSKAKPRPKDKEASTCRFGSRCCLGNKEHVMDGLVRQVSHRVKSFIMAWGV